MKPTDTWWEVNEAGNLICSFHGDQQRETIVVRKEDFPLQADRVANLINDAFDFGVRAKAQQIRMELGI